MDRVGSFGITPKNLEIKSATYFCLDAVGIQYESVYKQFVIETKTWMWKNEKVHFKKY